MKNIYLIVAPSGAGKTTIANILEKQYGLKSIQSYTTRPMRFKGETGHIFITDEEFDDLKNIVAYTEFAGYRYCATAQQVDENDLYVIDPKGVEYFKTHYTGSKNIKVIFINSGVSARYERMVARAKSGGVSHLEAVDSALKRISNDAHEFYDYIHHNVPVDHIAYNGESADVNVAAKDIYEFIKREEKGNESNKA